MMNQKLLYRLNVEQQGTGSWLYAYGFLAGRENKYFDANQLQQLFQANSEEQLLNIIREANYQGESVDQALINSKYEDIELLFSIIPDYDLLQIFLLFNEGHNLKVVLRSTLSADHKISLKTIEHLLLGPYLTEPRLILEAVRNSGLTELPDWMSNAIKKSEQEYLDSYDMSMVDLVVDKLMWQELIEQLKLIDSEWLLEYYLLKADLINLEILFRCKNLHLTEEFFIRSIINQGNIKLEEWLVYYKMSESELARELELLHLGEFVEFIDTYHEQGRASLFSQIADQHLIDLIHKVRYFSSGIEKTASYYLIREIERTNIKLARACLLHLISEDRYCSMVRPSYLGR